MKLFLCHNLLQMQLLVCKQMGIELTKRKCMGNAMWWTLALKQTKVARELVTRTCLL